MTPPAILDVIPDRPARLIVWARAMRQAHWPLSLIASLFDIDRTTRIDAGIEA